ncbi:hydrolase [Pyrenophora tritici-repentis]|uniref:Hydrolase (HAD superfamily) n=1 Tax=Pyrenophora tritici-repentis TaxID=45151 RepID=A0A2W1DRB6_9PLEO|nr:hydrolase [Pyrenophora tritici-repentis]KAF7447547.1 hydrolase [Pyrenophora tritici-repentis]KAF7569928.1 hydrolase (HAD superfamily) [Pyrenophora tritici-repentis]KAG9382361.1 hydrolase [Pyrenophora tritici-repentis]KAI0572965.1 hydrolase (HAD superfamily) [Pyrenophora tritici-repentis]
MTKSASFDVIGTCFEFSAPILAIEKRLSLKLQANSVDPKTLFFSWFYAAQRDFTYISMNGAYVPIAQVLKSTFRRACAVVDVPMDAITDEDVGAVMEAFKAMGPREGLKRCVDGLREAGWDVYGVTNGGSETSLGYYHSAGIDLDAEHLVSCDAIQIAKPDVRVYENANKHLTSMGHDEANAERWFVAAHAWDLIAARKAGFKTAYLDFEEHDPCTDCFGEFDLYATSMDDLLAKLRQLK